MILHVVQLNYTHNQSSLDYDSVTKHVCVHVEVVPGRS